MTDDVEDESFEKDLAKEFDIENTYFSWLD